MKNKPIIPKWLYKIPQSNSHGSTVIQKKYWRVVSDYVRIKGYKMGCIVCGRLSTIGWEYFQAGHYKSWASCRGYSKWDVMNIFCQCGFCNTGFNGNEVGAKFKENIIKLHGQERMDYIDKLSSYPTEKMEDHVIIPKILHIIHLMEPLLEKPKYYKEVIKLL